MDKKRLKTIGFISLSVILIISLTIVFLYLFGIIDNDNSYVAPDRAKIDESLFESGENADNSSKKETTESDKEAVGIRASAKPLGVIVLDPGHGISSSGMTAEQKTNDGWIYNSQKGSWGEWRHWKSGTVWQDCYGSGCTGRAPENGGCWYPISAGDRDTEPELNMNNALAAKKYLEKMGYEVRLTRTSNNNPSMTKRLEFCYPNGDTTKDPDADLFVCLHSNAGGGRGSYYIALSGNYDQAGINLPDFIESGNTLGKHINDRIVNETELTAASDGRYEGYPELILFCKSPITIAYMEIGFYDDASDLAILQRSSDAIGKAIAEGINDYMQN